MNTVVGAGQISVVEAIVLAVLLVVCLAGAWGLWQALRGRTDPDISGLKFHKRPGDNPPPQA
jgi:hypothetical protein